MNKFQKKISGYRLGLDYNILKKLLSSSVNKKHFKNSKIYGPEVTRYGTQYMKGFDIYIYIYIYLYIFIYIYIYL